MLKPAEHRSREFAGADEPTFDGFCSLTAYDAKTGECIASWLVEMASTVEQDSQRRPYRRVRLGYEIGTDGGRVTLEGRATGSDDDPEIEGHRTPVKIVVTLMHPRCATTELTLGAEYGQALRADVAARDDRPASQPMSPPPPRETDDDPLWLAFAAILAEQSGGGEANVSRLRRASALLFHEDGRDTGGRFREIHARANAYLDTLDT